MKTVSEHLRGRILDDRGVADKQAAPSLDELRETEWSPEFESLMRNRLVTGALRYGLLGSPKKPNYDRLGAIERGIREFRVTGNLELLVNAANHCMLEFVEGTHPNRHFAAADDGWHTEEL